MEREDPIPGFNTGKNRKIVIVLIVGILIVGGIGALIFYPRDSEYFTEDSGVKVSAGSLSTFDSIMEKAKKDGTNPNFRIENMSGSELFKVEHGGNVFLAQIANCDTIDTDASGKLICGTDYDTNITTMCTGDEVGLGNSSCLSIVDIDTDTVCGTSGICATVYEGGTALVSIYQAIGDYLTSIQLNNSYLRKITSFGGEVSGTYDAIVIGNDVLDDQYYDSEADLTTLLDDNYADIQWDYNQTKVDSVTNNLTLTGTTIGINGANILTWLRNIFYDSESDLTTLLNDNYADIQWDYNQTTPAEAYADTQDALQDECSEITNCVPNAWDADGDISADEIGEGKISFSTPCAAGNHYYLSGNDLACEADADTTYTASGFLLDLTGGAFSVNEGTLTDERVCEYESTGSQLECTLVKDGSGECGTNNVCLGGHLHSDTYFTETESNTNFVSRDTWTDIDSYPATCGASTPFIGTIGDTSTCRGLGSDTSPQLGGYLDTNTQNIGSTSDEIENIYMTTNNKLYQGTGQEFEIYYNGSCGILALSGGATLEICP